MNTCVILFSKNRTLQLKSLLLSLREYSDIKEEAISIVYVCSDPEISYQPLMQEFGCQFIEQNQFLQDVKGIVRSCDCRYVMFMVDDLIFRDHCSFDQVEKLMNDRADIDAFTFRLGENIDNPKKPEFEHVDDSFLVWHTAEDLGKYWNYFWDLSSSLYRRELVAKYLAKCRDHKETFPNPLEYHYYSCMPTTRASRAARIANIIRYPVTKRSQKIACYVKSKCLTQGVNLVAEIDSDRAEHFHPLDLHKKMLAGYVVDYRSLNELDLKSPQPGHHYFRLIPLSSCDT